LECDDRVVSSDDEQLILVDRDDHEIGFLAKADVHRGRGTLHRAFSLFVFNPAGELLLQQRAMNKRLWPGYWSNSCCSHPRRGETMVSAVRRRLREELGLSVTMKFLFKFEYQSQFDTYGAEHELCWVYAGCNADPPRVNSQEIAAWRYLDPESLQVEIDCAPQTFTPWFRLSWPRVALQCTLPDNPGDVDPVDHPRCR
jgi:isopentenyl-diphosphate delta-isomerase